MIYSSKPFDGKSEYFRVWGQRNVWPLQVSSKIISGSTKIDITTVDVLRLQGEKKPGKGFLIVWFYQLISCVKLYFLIN